jgi:hypothetical protein
MPKLPGVNPRHQCPGEGRQGKHIFLSKGSRRVVVPRNNPVDAYTMAAIVRDAGLSIDEFKALL